MLEIIDVQIKEDLLEVKRLFKEYADSLEINLDFQGFQEELTGLPGGYTSPGGAFSLPYGKAKWLAVWLSDSLVSPSAR